MACLQGGTATIDPIRHGDLEALGHALRACHPGVVLGQPTMPCRFQQGPHHQTAVIREGISVTHGPGEAVCVQARSALFHFGPVEIAVIPNTGEEIVQPENRFHGPTARKHPFPERKKIGGTFHQTGQFLEQTLALEQRMPGKPDITLGDITEPAMNHFGRTAGRSPGIIGLLQ